MNEPTPREVFDHFRREWRVELPEFIRDFWPFILAATALCTLVAIGTLFDTIRPIKNGVLELVVTFGAVFYLFDRLTAFCMRRYERRLARKWYDREMHNLESGRTRVDEADDPSWLRNGVAAARRDFRERQRPEPPKGGMIQ